MVSVLVFRRSVVAVITAAAAALLLGQGGVSRARPAGAVPSGSAVARTANASSSAIVPHNSLAAIYDVISQSFAPEAAAQDEATLKLIRRALQNEGYRVRWYGTTGNSGPATLTNFAKLPQASVVIIDTHGGYDPMELLVQRYRTAKAARLGVADYVRRFGARSRRWFEPLGTDNGLWLNPTGIRRFFAGKGVNLVANMACHAFFLAPAFQATAYFGKVSEHSCFSDAADYGQVFSRMAGHSGVPARTTVGAFGLGGFAGGVFNHRRVQDLRLVGSRPVVLSPAVTDTRPVDGSFVAPGTITGSVSFDAAMNAAESAGVVTVSGCGASISKERWSADRQTLDFDLKLPSNPPPGTLTLTVHHEKALGDPGKYPNDHLDGNQNPSPDTGVEPNRTDCKWTASCTAGAVVYLRVQLTETYSHMTNDGSETWASTAVTDTLHKTTPSDLQRDTQIPSTVLLSSSMNASTDERGSNPYKCTWTGSLVSGAEPHISLQQNGGTVYGLISWPDLLGTTWGQTLTSGGLSCPADASFNPTEGSVVNSSPGGGPFSSTDHFYNAIFPINPTGSGLLAPVSVSMTSTGDIPGEVDKSTASGTVTVSYGPCPVAATQCARLP